MADPISTLYRLLTDPQKGIIITADFLDQDGVYIKDDENHQLGPNMSPPTVDVKVNPYQQEDQTQTPLVVVGPRRLATKSDFVGGSFAEVHEMVELRIVTRTQTGGDMGYTADGNSTRNKLLENIRAIVKANQSNPDGTGAFIYMRTSDPGSRNPDLPEGTPLYKTAMQVEFCWLE